MYVTSKTKIHLILVCQFNKGFLNPYGNNLDDFKFENFILGKDMKEVKYARNRILGLHKKLKISIHMTITLKIPKKGGKRQKQTLLGKSVYFLSMTNWSNSLLNQLNNYKKRYIRIYGPWHPRPSYVFI